MSASTAAQLALCTGERRDRASRAWKVVGQIKERVVYLKSETGMAKEAVAEN